MILEFFIFTGVVFGGIVVGVYLGIYLAEKKYKIPKNKRLI